MFGIYDFDGNGKDLKIEIIKSKIDVFKILFSRYTNIVSQFN